MVSLTDIAQQAEVSVSLVSRVLSNRMGNVGVTEEKQKRIRQIARRLGYVPNRPAQSLVRRKSGVIGLIAPRPPADSVGRNPWNSHYLHQILSAMEIECDARGYHSLFSHWTFDAGGLSHPRAMLDRSVDGVVLADFTRGGVVSDLVSLGIPCVQIGSNIETSTPIDCYYGDLEQAVREAVAHLASCGHTRLVLHGGIGPGVEQIAAAFAGAASEAGVPHAFERIPTDFSGKIATPAGGHGGHPAHIVLSAPYAIELASGLAEAGLTCPADYSLVSVVSEGWPTIHLPGWIPLSTIVLSNFEAARAAAHDLIARIEDRRGEEAPVPRRHLFPCPIQWTESVSRRFASKPGKKQGSRS